MKTLIIIVTVFVTSIVLNFATQTLVAQDAPGTSVPVKEHEFLQKFVGEWDVESEGAGMKNKAVMRSSMLGKLWLVNSSDHKMQGMKLTSMQIIGYDSDKKKYVGTWVDSMTSFLWRYEGTVDKTGSKLTLDTQGPSMSGDGTMVKYQDAFEFKDKDTIIATSAMQDDNGNWSVFMKGTAKRRSKASSISAEEFQRTEAEIKKAVEKGEVSAEDAERRLVEMRKKIRDDK